MKSRVVLIVAMLWLVSNQSIHAELEGFFPTEGGPITISPTGTAIQTSGIQFVPVEGTIEEGESPAPFAFFLPNRANPEYVALGVLGTTVTIDGSVTLDVIASSDAVIEGKWGMGIEPIPFPVARLGSESILEGSFPFDGGAVTVQPRFTNFPVEARELTLEATSARLVGGGSAAPFASLTENTDQRWSANSLTSVVIDGRIADVIDTGVIDNALVMPRFVLAELQAIADSSDKMRRAKGRRGLDVLDKMRNNSDIDLKIYDRELPEMQGQPVDMKLLMLARHLEGKVVTGDFNLNKVAKLQNVPVINLNEIANSLKPVFLPGEQISIRIVKAGETAGQGVGYLDDGTMIVVEDGKDSIGREVQITVTSMLQTSAGRMVFGRVGF